METGCPIIPENCPYNVSSLINLLQPHGYGKWQLVIQPGKPIPELGGASFQIILHCESKDEPVHVTIDVPVVPSSQALEQTNRIKQWIAQWLPSPAATSAPTTTHSSTTATEWPLFGSVLENGLTCRYQLQIPRPLFDPAHSHKIVGLAFDHKPFLVIQ